MSYPDSGLNAVGGFNQYVAREPVATPRRFKITPVQRQILEYATTGNLAGIQKMVAEHKTPRGLMPDKLVNCTIPSAKSHSLYENGWTPLMWAIKGGHVKCVAALYEAGARTDGRFTQELGRPATPWEYMVRWGEYDLNPLMYAVMLVSEGKIDIECVRVLFARRKGSSVPPTNMHQTERSHLIQEVFYGEEGNKLSALTLAIRMSNHNRQSLTNYKITFSKLIELIKLLLENRVLVRRSDFLIFNLQNTEILKLLLADVEETIAIRCDYLLPMINDEGYLDEDYDFTHFNDSVDADYLLRISHHLYASANVLLDYYTSHKIIHPNPDGNKFFAEVIRCQVSEMVRACVERKLPVSGNIKMDGRITSVSWDILRELSAYRERREEDVNLSPKLVRKIIHRNDFLLDAAVDVDVLTGVPDDICAWGNEGGHPYELEIEKVLPINLDFAIKHGFDPNVFQVPLLVHVHNQAEFDKAFLFMFMFMKDIVLDLGEKTYSLPTTGMDFGGESVFRIQNGYITGDFEYLLQSFWQFQVAKTVNLTVGHCNVGDIITIQKENQPPFTGMLSKVPLNGWYTFADGQQKRAKKEFVTKISIPLEITPVDAPAVSVIMNALLQQLNVNLILGDVDELDFEDDYWSAQTAETLGNMTWGLQKDENVLGYLLAHPWNESDQYEDGDIFNIFKRFVQQGAFVPKEFGQLLLNNAASYPVQDAVAIYDLLRANCPGYTFGTAEKKIFVEFANNNTKRIETLKVSGLGYVVFFPTTPVWETDRTLQTLKFYEYVLGVEKQEELPLTPIFIRKICEMIQEFPSYNPKKKELSSFLVHVLAPESPSSDPQFLAKCVERLLDAGFDPNGVTKPYHIPLMHVLKWRNDLILQLLLKNARLEPNKNIADNVQATALEKFLVEPASFEQWTDRTGSYSDQDRIMINLMLEDDRVECPFCRHTLTAETIKTNLKIMDVFMQRKLRKGARDKPRNWYFDPNTVPLYEMRRQNIWKKRLQEQGIEPRWQDKEDEYTKKVCTKMPAAVRVLHWRGLALQHLPWKTRKFLPVVRTAVRSNGLALQFVTARHMMSWDIVKYAVAQNWRAFQFLPQKAIYERVKEAVSYKERQDVQELLVYSEDLNNEIRDTLDYSSVGKVVTMERIIQDIKLSSDREDLAAIAEKILTVASKIRAGWVSEPYEYGGLPSQSEPGFVIWMHHLFDKNGPHEGQWPEFKEMFPDEAAYVEMNPDTHEGQKEIEQEKSHERKEREKEHIKKMRDAVHAQSGPEVDIVHWDDFEPIMFS